MKPEFSASSAMRHEGLAEAKLPLMLIATLCVALVVGLVLKHTVPADAVLPALVLLTFLSAGAAGLAGLMSGRSFRQAILDMAGVLTFVGIFAAVAVEPDQMALLMEGTRGEH